MIRVTATANDGTEASDYIEYTVVNGNPVLQMIDRSGWIYRNSTGYAEFFCNQRFKDSDDGYCDFIVTSSNSKVVSARDILISGGNDGYYYVRFVSGNVKGNATVTIKTTDGSNRSCSFKVTVK